MVYIYNSGFICVCISDFFHLPPKSLTSRFLCDLTFPCVSHVTQLHSAPYFPRVKVSSVLLL